MQSPPVNPSEMLIAQQLENNSGSSFFAAAVLIIIFAFFIYTVVLPKFKNTQEDTKKDNKNSEDSQE